VISRKPIPVVLDTDVGSDIDDTWAIAMMLRSPELDVRLMVSATANTEYRAKLIAKQLERAGRTDVAVGIGVRGTSSPEWEKMAEWVADYCLGSYPGKLHDDGVGAIIEAIMTSKEPVTLISIGPLPNIAAALGREPRIAARARFVGMHGSVRRKYTGEPGQDAEYNVKADVAAAQKVFTAPWKEIVITPLDTCGMIRLTGERYQKIRRSSDPAVRAVLENYDLWRKNYTWPHAPKPSEGESSILFDTVAIYLAFTTERLKMERLGIRITEEGLTAEDPGAPQMNVAVEWPDLEGYYDFLVGRLLGEK
jgi:inosine-uridine nucleoside N-ribohydrolase